MDNNLIIVGALIIIGAGFIIHSALFLRKRAKMKERGNLTTATVTNVNISTKIVKKNKRHVKKTIYACTLEYMSDNKQVSVKHSTEQPRAVGDTIEIAYLPDDPEQFMPAELLADTLTNKFTPFVFIAVGTLLLVVGAVIYF
jgi:hypothetical protein